MSRTWVVGDLHGCAGELAALLQRLELRAGDRFLSCGDLFHRGPDPLGVMELLQELPGRGVDFGLVLGNHERVLLQRFGLAGEALDGSDGGRLGPEIEELGAEDLRGDGRTPMENVPAGRGPELLRFLERRPYVLHGPLGGRHWILVHAGIVPGLPLERTRPAQLLRLRRLRELPGAPYWYEIYEGPNLVLFGHTPSEVPRTRHAGGHLVALGLDTGCVYGGRLSAWCLEEEELVQVEASRAWVS